MLTMPVTVNDQYHELHQNLIGIAVWDTAADICFIDIC